VGLCEVITANGIMGKIKKPARGLGYDRVDRSSQEEQKDDCFKRFVAEKCN